NEELIDLQDIFDNEKFSEKERFVLMDEQLEDEIDYDTWKPALEDINDLEVYIDSDKFIFYFSDDNLIANDNNVLEVPVGTAQLADYLTANYYDLFILTEIA